MRLCSGGQRGIEMNALMIAFLTGVLAGIVLTIFILWATYQLSH